MPLPSDPTTRIRTLLDFIYGAEAAEEIARRLAALMAEFRPQLPPPPARAAFFDERDAVLITYGDMLQRADEAPLVTLNRFLTRQVAGLINTIHLLPFYPYSSDDGFSVIDYLAVNPDLGDWEDIARLRGSFKLMFDAVINHMSRASAWFQAFQRGEPPYTDYFTVVDPAADLSAVFRPRALPLLTPVETNAGLKHVWTTFSADQIDLNYASPDLLLEIVRVLLRYVAHGADLIRLDAIGFMWKEIGTRCLHLPRAHALIQLFRALLDAVAPQVALVTETNVPHHENISYFGDGRHEAQMVYNFSLPPLTLHAFHSGDATILSRWAATLELPSDRVTFFNFLASHDGIGVTPARGILPSEAIEALAARVQALGGFVSFKANSDGTQSAYELNINYLDALGAPGVKDSAETQAQRFLAAQSIMLALRGVPGIYFHSLFGSRGWPEGVARTGRYRTINREKLAVTRLEEEQRDGLRRLVFEGYRRLLGVRSAEPAFNPYGVQTILNLHPAVLAVERRHRASTVLCLTNVSDTAASVALPYAGRDLLTDVQLPVANYQLPPYGILWLQAALRRLTT